MRALWIILGIIGAGLILLILNHDRGSFLGMQNDTFASVLFMGIWATIIGAAIIPRAGGLGAAARNAAIWIAIILVLMAGYVYRFDLQDIGSRMTAGLIPGSPVSSQSIDGRQQVMIIRGNNGQFGARASVNGTQTGFLVDTGASAVVLTYEDAERAGIDVERLSYTIPVSTANGMTSAARVSIGAIQLGNLERENIGAMVAQKGDLAISLLGMTFLNSLWSFEVRGDRMILTD
jgi:aspartyl protease family protein